jgi:hypothetical protein
MRSLTGKAIAFRFCVYLIIEDYFDRIETVMLLKRCAAVVEFFNNNVSHDMHLSDIENIKKQLFNVFIEREMGIPLNRIRVTYKVKDVCYQMVNCHYCIQSIKLRYIGSRYDLRMLKTLLSMSKRSSYIVRN